jgi:tetratricopeptide (TPR) repeat protein
MTRYIAYFISIVGMALMVACKTEPKATLKVDDAAFNAVRAAYDKSPTEDTYSKLVQAYGKVIVAETDPTRKEKLLVDAIDVCEKMTKHNMAITFALELIKSNPKSPKAKPYYQFIADQMLMRKKDDVAHVIMKGYLNVYGDKGENQKIADALPTWTRDIPAMLDERSKGLFDSQGGLDKVAIQNYIDLCESYALVFAADPRSPEYLFKAAEMARALNDLPKTISLYDWIVSYYPTSRNASKALFLKAFTIDNDLKKYDIARETYQEFLKRYPTDSLSKDVKVLIDNLGKSEEQLIKEFEKKNKK